MQDKIRLGMAVLDNRCPDWYWRVSLKELRMEYETCCVLGQLYGSYDVAKSKVGLDDKRAYGLGFISWWQLNLGNWVPFLGRRLTRAWEKAIKNRRNSDEFEYVMSKVVVKELKETVG